MLAVSCLCIELSLTFQSRRVLLLHHLLYFGWHRIFIGFKHLYRRKFDISDGIRDNIERLCCIYYRRLSFMLLIVPILLIIFMCSILIRFRNLYIFKVTGVVNRNDKQTVNSRLFWKRFISGRGYLKKCNKWHSLIWKTESDRPRIDQEWTGDRPSDQVVGCTADIPWQVRRTACNPWLGRLFALSSPFLDLTSLLALMKTIFITIIA